MKVEGKYKFLASQEQIWDLFMDQKNLEKAIPGCEKMEEREPGKYDVLLKIGIAAIKGTYTGKIEVVDPEPPNRYRLLGEGSGSPGFVKGEATIELSQEGQHTIVSYQGDMQVGGLIAGIGQRMIGGITKMMAGQFFKKMAKELKSQQ